MINKIKTAEEICKLVQTKKSEVHKDNLMSIINRVYHNDGKLSTRPTRHGGTESDPKIYYMYNNYFEMFLTPEVIDDLIKLGYKVEIKEEEFLVKIKDKIIDRFFLPNKHIKEFKKRTVKYYEISACCGDNNEQKISE